MKRNGIVLAGTNNGCGISTVMSAVIGALVKRKLDVQAFKVGPEHRDPILHTFITGKNSRSLDGCLLSEEIVSFLYEKNSSGSDISVIEGAGGIFDCRGGCSTAHIARLTGAPVILVLDGSGISLTACAVLQGIISFDTEISIKGVIFNNIEEKSHYEYLKEIIEERTNISVLGYMPKMYDVSIRGYESEPEMISEKLLRLAVQAEETIDLELLVKISKDSEEIETSSFFNIARRKLGPSIAVAKDRCFKFYYSDSLELLELMGAELRFFSPINDRALPGTVHGIYIGGGCPQNFSGELNENTSMVYEIKEQINMGLPAYAESEGLIYLSESVRQKDGNILNMAGVLPVKCEITDNEKAQYVDIEVNCDNVVSKKGYRIKGYDQRGFNVIFDEAKTCFNISSREHEEVPEWNCGIVHQNLISCRPYLNFWGNTGFAERFVNSCINYMCRKKDFSYL